MLDTKSEEFVAYTTGNSELNFSSFYTPYLFDFRTRMSAGYALSNTDNQISVEADYGLIGEFDGSVLIVKAYNHTNKTLNITSASIYALDVTTDTKTDCVLGETAKKFQCASLPNGSPTTSLYTTQSIRNMNRINKPFKARSTLSVKFRAQKNIAPLVGLNARGAIFLFRRYGLRTEYRNTG